MMEDLTRSRKSDNTSTAPTEDTIKTNIIDSKEHFLKTNVSDLHIGRTVVSTPEQSSAWLKYVPREDKSISEETT